MYVHSTSFKLKIYVWKLYPVRQVKIKRPIKIVLQNNLYGTMYFGQILKSVKEEFIHAHTHTHIFKKWFLIKSASALESAN